MAGHQRFKAGDILVVDGKPLGLIRSYRQAGNLLDIEGRETGVPITSVSYVKQEYYY